MKLLILVLPILVLGSYVVPRANGPYGVSIEDVILVDHDLNDPYLNLSERRIAASIISSIGPSSLCKPIQQPYLPLKAAQFWEQALGEALEVDLNNTLSQTTLELCQPCSDHKHKNTPLVLFAPAAAIARQLYHVLMTRFVAQTGYTVVTFEQPGYVEYEVFPDGTVEKQQRVFPAGGPIDTLVQDVGFVLDAFNSSQAAMWGHSEGGGLTGASVIAEPRLLGGIDLDGGFYNSSTSLLSHTTAKPFMLLSRTGHNQSNSETPWSTVWQNLLGDKWQLQLNRSVHTTFSDAPYLVRDLYRLDESVNATVIAAGVGTIPGLTALQDISGIAAAFFNYTFGGTGADEVLSTAEDLGWYTVQNVTVLSRGR